MILGGNSFSAEGEGKQEKKISCEKRREHDLVVGGKTKTGSVD